MTISWVTSTKYRNILKTIPCLPHGGETLISSVGPHPLEGSHSHYRLTLHSKGDKIKALGDACHSSSAFNSGSRDSDKSVSCLCVLDHEQSFWLG